MCHCSSRVWSPHQYKEDTQTQAVSSVAVIKNTHLTLTVSVALVSFRAEEVCSNNKRQGGGNKVNPKQSVTLGYHLALLSSSSSFFYKRVLPEVMTLTLSVLSVSLLIQRPYLSSYVTLLYIQRVYLLTGGASKAASR